MKVLKKYITGKKIIPWIILALILLAWYFFTPIERIEIKTKSMEPNLSDGKIAWHSYIPHIIFGIERGDVVTYWATKEKKRYFLINRVIAIPGDKVMIRNGYVILNGNKIDEPYSKGDTLTINENVISEGHEYFLQDNEYFILGDNRENSNFDSRILGLTKGNVEINNIAETNSFIEGKVFAF